MITEMLKPENVRIIGASYGSDLCIEHADHGCVRTAEGGSLHVDAAEFNQQSREQSNGKARDQRTDNYAAEVFCAAA